MCVCDFITCHGDSDTTSVLQHCTCFIYLYKVRKNITICICGAIPMCPILGVPIEHNRRNLPTFSDTIKHYLLLRHQSKIELNSKDPSFKDISSKIVDHIKKYLEESLNSSSISKAN